MHKICIYVAGISNMLREEILTILKFSLGSMPFKYLGVPMASRKINVNVQQCMPLVDKITTKVKYWISRFLSYRGRVQLIKNVLFEMQTY